MNQSAFEEYSNQNTPDFFSIIAENSSDSFWIMDGNLHFTYISPSTQKITGYPLDEWISLGWQNIIHPEYYHNVLHGFERLKARIIQNLVISFIGYHKSGSQIWIEINASSYNDINGNFVGIVGVTRDITAQKTAEIELLDSLQTCSNIINTVPAGLMIFKISPTNDFLLISINEDAQKMTGLTPSEVIGKEATMIFPNIRDFDIFQKAIEVSKTGVTYETDDFNYEDNDIQGIFRVRVFMLSQNRLGFAFEDISIVKKAEKVDQELGLILSYSKDFIGSFSLDLKTNFINDAGKEIVGIENGSHSNEYSLLDFYHPNVLEFIKTTVIPTVLEKGRWRGETQFKHFITGQPIDVIHDIYVIKKPFTGEIINISTITIDISVQKRVEAALEKRIIALTQPLDDLEKIAISDIFNIDELQNIQDRFSEATGVSAVMTYLNGNLITQRSNFTELCGDIMLNSTKGCELCLKSNPIPGSPLDDRKMGEYCKSIGLMHAGAKITVGGQHIANWLIGQVRDNSVTEDHVRALAQRIDEDEEKLVEAFYKVPSMDADTFEKVAHSLYHIANQMSNSAYQNVQQARLIAQLKAAETEIKESEDKVLTIGNAALDAVIIIDQNGNIVYWNPAAEKIFGHTEQDVIGKNVHQLIMPEKYRAQFEGAWAKFLSTHQGNIIGKVIEMEGLHANGSIFPVEVALSQVSGKNNNWLLAYIRDITERKNAQLELITAKEKAEESNRLKSHFLTNMSHEIRTPMNGILGFLSLLQDIDLSHETRDKYINIINKSGERLLSTINDIIEMSKIESGHLHTDIEDVNILLIMNDLIDFFQPEIYEKGLKLKTKLLIEKDHLFIKTDKHKLEGILTNLIKNAIKFTSSGYIEIGNYVKEDRMIFYVKDTGIGISKENTNQIFERFVQADTSLTRNYEGSGLGLSIAKAYIDSLEGQIWVESEKGIGSTFFVSLPYQTILHKDEYFYDKRSLIPNLKNGLNILIAEDDETSFLYLMTILKGITNKVYRAESGEDSIKIVQEHPEIDLILMDIKMPGMNGLDATKRIRAFHHNIIIIVQSAFAMSEDSQLAIESGCNEYISKPINRELLIALIGKYFS